MPENNKPAAAKPIVDVAHPGDSAPSSNSKSVIVSNRPLLKDPMMVTDETDSSAAADTAANDSEDKPAISGVSNKANPALADPLLETEAPAKPEEPTETEKPPEAKPIEPAKPASSDEPADQPTQKDEPTDDKGKSETPDEESNSEAEPAKTDAAKQVEAEDNEAAKRQAAITKLADSKQYYLPINTVEKQRSRRFVALGIVLSLLLIVAWADIALDAGLIHVGNIKSPTHFFSN